MNARYYDYILGSFIAVLLISNVVSAKILQLGPFTFDGGTILFPFAYIFGDIFTEVYGFKRARKIIWIGFIANLLMAAVFILVGKLPPAPGWENQQAYEVILGWVPRIVMASLIAYWAGEFLNSYILAKMKIMTRGRWLFARTITSTLGGEALDTTLFCLIAFFGKIPFPLLVTVILSNYFFKCGVEIVFTPFTYMIVNFLKRQEKMDPFDIHTDFNPFTLRE
jgi:queuosine precursor transporter